MFHFKQVFFQTKPLYRSGETNVFTKLQANNFITTIFKHSGETI